MTLAAIKPPPISFGLYAWRIPDPRDRRRVRGVYRELSSRLGPTHARCVIVDLLCAGMNGRTLVASP